MSADVNLGQLRDLLRDLVCYCELGSSVVGTPQEIIQNRLANLFGISIPEVHVLLDLQLDVLDEILDEPHEGWREDELTRRMAKRSGLPVDWVGKFNDAWERIGDEVNP